jgi:4'-phosphopantetheinyl transferase
MPDLPDDGCDDGCQVWWVRWHGLPEGLTGLLDDAERARHDELRHAADQARFRAAHALARLVAARALGRPPDRIDVTAVCRGCAGPHGRPFVTHEGGTLRLSISHSGGYAVVALTVRDEVGVDVERIALRGAQMPVTALSGPERLALGALPLAARPAGFIRYWTRKEAVLKATGDGLTVAPSRLTVTAPDEPPRLLDWIDRPPPHPPVFLADLPAPAGYLGSLATLGRRPRITEHDGRELLLEHLRPEMANTSP